MAEQPIIFALSGTFAGKNRQTGARWIKKLEHDLISKTVNGVVPPEILLKSIDLLLGEDAEIWADESPAVKRLLNLDEPTAADVPTLKGFFSDCFPAKTVPETIQLSFNVELAYFKQGENEILPAYYRRMVSLMHRVSLPNRSPRIEMKALESAILDMVIKAFIIGLADRDIRQIIPKCLS